MLSRSEINGAAQRPVYAATGENQLAKWKTAIIQNQLPKNAQRPSRPVHALLAGISHLIPVILWQPPRDFYNQLVYKAFRSFEALP
jgi:hypothetical protein